MICCAHFAASPFFLVINMRAGFKLLKSDIVSCAFSMEPVRGLKVTTGFTVRLDFRPSNRACNKSAFHDVKSWQSCCSLMSEEDKDQSGATMSYRISNGPVVRLARSDPKLPGDRAEVVELPRVYGDPLLFAVPRDPHTLFVYWLIDWSSIFGQSAPVDRQVHLRIQRGESTEETTVAVEPMAGNCYVTVSQSRAIYRVEIGYYQPQEALNSVAISETVTTPAGSVSANVDVDLATIPFHLSFQHLIDLFRASNQDA